MKKWKRNGRKKLKDKKIEIISQYIIIGKQGAALRLPECEFVKKWFNVTDSVLHVSLYVGSKRSRTNDEKGRTKQMGTNRKSVDFSFS